MKDKTKANVASGESQSVTSQEGFSRKLHGWQLVIVVTGLALSLFMSALDQSVIATALPKIANELNGLHSYAWIATAYLLATATVIPIVGRLSDQFGRKWFLVTGIVLFLIGSGLCGTAQTMTQLILFRGFQGIGAGCMIPLVSTLIGDVFSPRERGRWQGLFVAVAMIANIIGPLAGGLLVDRATWRWIFYLNIPVGILALVVLIIWLPISISVRTSQLSGWAAIKQIDGFGGLTSAAATICLLLSLSWGGKTYTWGSTQVITLVIATIVLYLVFFVIEGRVAEPILPLDLLRNPTFTACSLLAATYGFFFLSVVFFVPLFIQAVLGQPATSSSAALAPLLLAFTLSSIVTGVLVTKIGRYKIFSVIGSIFILGSAFLLTVMNTMTTLGFVTITMLVAGVGFGMVNNIIMLAGQNAVPVGRLGIATGVISYLRTMGNTIGTAVTAALAINVSASQLASTAGRNALANGLHSGFLVLVALSILMFLITVLLKDLHLSKIMYEAPQAADQ